MKVRILVAALTLSAAGLIGIAVQESYTATAIIPTAGDRPTSGFGSTVREDGSRVRMGDKTDPVRALRTVQAHLGREEVQFRDSLPGVRLTQGEYDLYVDFMYQYGIGNWRASSMRRHLLATDEAQTPAWANAEYKAACVALLAWRKSAGYDCSTTINGKPNKRCWGVWDRQLKRHAQCQAEQK